MELPEEGDPAEYITTNAFPLKRIRFHLSRTEKYYELINIITSPAIMVFEKLTETNEEYVTCMRHEYAYELKTRERDDEIVKELEKLWQDYGDERKKDIEYNANRRKKLNRTRRRNKMQWIQEEESKDDERLRNERKRRVVLSKRATHRPKGKMWKWKENVDKKKMLAALRKNKKTPIICPRCGVVTGTME